MRLRRYYGYRKSAADKNVWEVDEEAAKIVQRIFRMCVEGYGPTQIAKRLSDDGVLIPTAYAVSKLFARLYEDNVAGKITDERFSIMSKTYEDEQYKLKEESLVLSAFIEAKEQKTEDIAQFISIVRKYEYITELTPELMHELIDHIEIHAPDKNSGRRQQKVDIYFRFKAATASAVISRKDYKNRKQTA